MYGRGLIGHKFVFIEIWGDTILILAFNFNEKKTLERFSENLFIKKKLLTKFDKKFTFKIFFSCFYKKPLKFFSILEKTFWLEIFRYKKNYNLKLITTDEKN